MVNPSPDVIVVGGGIVGTACARALAAEGMRVQVLEADFVGSGATAAGMGHLVVMDDSAAELELTAYSRTLWLERFAELPLACEVDPCGTLWIAASEEQWVAVREKHRLYDGFGIDAEVLDAEALAECEPNLRPGLAGALRVPGDAVLYPPAAARWLMKDAQRFGAELREGCRVEEIGQGWVKVVGERISAGIVLNAAGTEAPRLTRGLPILPRKGHLVITDRHPGFCRHQLVELGYLTSAHEMSAESIAFNVQPRKTGQLLIGSSRELVGWDASINRPLVAAMLSRAVGFIPALARLRVIRTWTGFRPASLDGLPLIGKWDEGEGIWVAAGHEGLGISTSLGTAQLLTDLIMGRQPRIDPAPFSPTRAAGQIGGAA